MELLELLRILQNSQDQATAETNRQAIQDLTYALQHDLTRLSHWDTFLLIMIFVVCISALINAIEQKRELKKLKKIISKLNSKNQENS